MERSISISELSAENGVPVVNVTGRLLETTKITSMIAQRRFVDICTSPQWKYPLFGLKFEKLIRPVLFANIDLNWPYTFWDRTYCDSEGQCVSLWRSHWSNIWCWTTSLWTHCRCRGEQRVQVTTNNSKFIWCPKLYKSNRKVPLKKNSKIRNAWRVRLYSTSQWGFYKKNQLTS